jgi:hypothetical protein
VAVAAFKTWLGPALHGPVGVAVALVDVEVVVMEDVELADVAELDELPEEDELLPVAVEEPVAEPVADVAVVDPETVVVLEQMPVSTMIKDRGVQPAGI